MLAEALRQIANDPSGPLTRARNKLPGGPRSFHVRHTHIGNSVQRVRNPVHVLYYRAVSPGLIEISRVPHDRMEPARHLREDDPG